MKQSACKDFLIRNIPLELYSLLEKSAILNHRSKTQQAIVALEQGLRTQIKPLQKPKPFNLGDGVKISSKLIYNIIDQNRE